ncbi:MAG: glycoside hydrolase family 3 N-terminal domain-containing protein [Ruminococcus sp.]
MKYQMQISFLAAAAFTMIACGCSGQTIDSLKTDTTETITATESSTEENVSVTTSVPVETSEPSITSGTTCTTKETDFGTVELLLSNMTLDEKIYQMFVVTPEALTGFSGNVTEAGDLTKSALASTPVGGLIYFSQNLESWNQTHDMLTRTQQYAQDANNGIGLLLAVDEEGGSVARVSEKLGTYISYDMQYYGTNLDYDSVYNLGSTIGSSLRELGFNLDLAPVADVDISSENELGSRIFSSDAQVVSDMTAQFVLGLEGTGISSTLKHFPGLGAGTGNTHNGSVVIDRTHVQLSETEFVAFQGGMEAGADFVMVGHQIITSALDDAPGDLSETVVTDWLKEELGFTGLVITDSHSMRAITENYMPGDAAVQAIQAGVDIILMPYDLSNAFYGVRTAVEEERISEERIDESVRKILNKKYELGVIAIESNETSTETVQ